MKTSITFILLLAMVLPANAQYQQQGGYGGGYGYGQQQPQSSYTFKECEATRKTNFTARTTSTSPEPIALDRCEELYVIAAANGQQFGSPTMEATVDNKYICRKYGGFTLDFDDCNRVKSAYNQVLMAEQAMFALQTIKINENNIAAKKEYDKRAAAGDGQNAAIDATIARNEQNAAMYKKQVMVYSGAVLYLGSMLASWQGKRDKKLGNMCGKQKAKVSAVVKDQLGVKPDQWQEPNCGKILSQWKDEQELFANDNMKGQFLLASADYLRKLAEAKRKAGINEEVAEKLKNSQQGINDPDAPIMDRCILDPKADGCQVVKPRHTAGGTFKGNSLNFGSGPGANGSFDFGPNGGADIKPEDMTASDEPEKVNDVASPFEDEAKKASGILDPASAASVSAGQQESAPGGGGAGGGGGGGSASLGDDLAGATGDDNKDPDIATNKVSGKYAKGKGGAGFTAVKSAKDEANPLAGLFDQKGGEEGGIEEDRSIAGEIDGEGSGLFQKISKKYGQVQQDKRLQDLE